MARPLDRSAARPSQKAHKPAAVYPEQSPRLSRSAPPRLRIAFRPIVPQPTRLDASTRPDRRTTALAAAHRRKNRWKVGWCPVKMGRRLVKFHRHWSGGVRGPRRGPGPCSGAATLMRVLPPAAPGSGAKEEMRAGTGPKWNRLGFGVDRPRPSMDRPRARPLAANGCHRTRAILFKRMEGAFTGFSPNQDWVLAFSLRSAAQIIGRGLLLWGGLCRRCSAVPSSRPRPSDSSSASRLTESPHVCHRAPCISSICTLRGLRPTWASTEQ